MRHSAAARRGKEVCSEVAKRIKIAGVGSESDEGIQALWHDEEARGLLAHFVVLMLLFSTLQVLITPAEGERGDGTIWSQERRGKARA